MKQAIYICGAIGSALAMASPAAAQWTVLQIVDLVELGMSAEGGEATLYRTPYAQRGNCRIQVIHFGENGKTITEFEFGSKLSAAEKREYRYKVPLSVDAKAKPALAKKFKLASREGREVLPKEFETYKAVFDSKKVADCAKR